MSNDTRPSKSSDEPHHQDNDTPQNGVSRRDLLGSAAVGAAFGALATAGIGEAMAAPPDGAGDKGLGNRLEKANADPNRRILLKGGTIISMDPAVGNFAQGDLLIQGDKIAGIGPNLSASGNVIRVDVPEMIIIPGFCDPHIHSWQGQIPRLIPNQNSDTADTTHNYFTVYHNTFAPAYRPEDMYIGTLMTMLAAMNGGITTVCDNSHNSRSSEHSDAAIEALFASGIRGVHASGPPSFGTWDMQWPQDVYRIKQKYFSSNDQLVTLRLIPRAAFPGNHPAVLKVRKDLDLWMSFDGGSNLPLASLYASGDYNGKESYNHGTNFSAAQRQIVVENHAKVNICPRIDSQFGTTGRGIPWTQEWLDLGARPGISSDDPGTYAVDFFTEMHVMYAFQRGMANFNSLPLDKRITVRDVLEFATIRGAECCAVDHKVGTLKPGKEADIVLINTNDISIYPKHNAILTVVEGATIGHVDTVFIAGKVRKWRGQLTGIDLNAIRQRSDASRDFLFAQTGWPKDKIDFSD